MFINYNTDILIFLDNQYTTKNTRGKLTPPSRCLVSLQADLNDDANSGRLMFSSYQSFSSLNQEYLLGGS